MAFHARVVDISSWVSGGIDRSRTRCAEAIDEALSESSVVQITGHGIPDSILAGLADGMDALFALDDDAKAALVAPAGHNRGYSGFGSESLGMTLGLDPARDRFEAFNVGASKSDYPLARPAGIAYADSLWPAIPAFQRSVDSYFNEAGRVTRTLMNVLGESLGVGRTYFRELTDYSIDTLRLNHFPAGGSMGAHTDFGITTLAWVEPGGLQVAHDGAWSTVEPEPGALLVFVGDLLSQITNGRWPATLHRVVATSDRRSAMFYHDGNADATIAALPALLAPGELPALAPVTVADHLAAKLGASRSGVPYAGSAPAIARLPRD